MMRSTILGIALVISVFGFWGCHRVHHETSDEESEGTMTETSSDSVQISSSENEVATETVLDSDTLSPVETDSGTLVDTVDVVDTQTATEDTSPGTDTGIDTESSDMETDAFTDSSTDTSPCLEGNIYIWSQEEADALNGVECIFGNLSIGESGEDFHVTLPDLIEISGVLSILGNDDTCMVEFENLATVGSLYISSNARLEANLSTLAVARDSVHISDNGQAENGDISIDLSALLQTGSVLITSNPAKLLTVRMDHLVTIDEDLIVEGNMGLGIIELGDLTTISRQIIISAENALKLVRMESLIHSPSILISANSALQEIDLGHMETADGSVVFANNAALESIDVGELVSVSNGNFVIAENPILSTLKLDVLKEVQTELSILKNGSLDCDADAMVAKVTVTQATFCENKLDGTCGQDECVFTESP